MLTSMSSRYPNIVAFRDKDWNMRKILSCICRKNDEFSDDQYLCLDIDVSSANELTNSSMRQFPIGDQFAFDYMRSS